VIAECPAISSEFSITNVLFLGFLAYASNQYGQGVSHARLIVEGQRFPDARRLDGPQR
jgi:hypothetical protein